MTLIPGQSVAITLQELAHEAAQQATQQNNAVLVSVTERVYGSYDAVELFDHSRAVTADRFFWSQPDRAFTLVGLGIAHALDAVEESRFRQIGTSWRQILSKAILEDPYGLPGTGPLLLGGFAFDTQRAKSQLWHGFPDGRMVLPRVLFTMINGETWLTCNILVQPDSNPDDEAADLSALVEELLNSTPSYSTEPKVAKLQVFSRELRPAEAWKHEVVLTAADIRQGKLEKAVLARPVLLEASDDFDLASTLRNLSNAYSDCNVFAIARDERCFLGATPERLAEVRDGEVRTMSLAGTIRRGATPAEDEALGTALLESAKDRREHAVVVQTLVETLARLCDDLQVDASPSLLKLGNVQHLYTLIKGHLPGDYTLLDVIELLHPTPAMGGRPRDKALALIREREGFDRGWYAAPVGWMDRNGEGEFAVAIRSALVYHNQATLFAGCGIVADSDPEREYAESCLKLKPMLSALTGE